ncbi:MAG: hypothetical protein R3B70_46510 [Polyangiaceae bacterium]
MRLWKGAVGLAMMVPLGMVIGIQAIGCESEPSVSGSAGSAGSTNVGGAGGAGASSGTTNNTGGDIGLGGSIGSGGTDKDAACVATSAEATLEKKPVDIMFIIDNSGSMGDNIESVQNNINDSFAAIIGESGIDYRVIMISEHGPLGAESICVKAPLSSTDCNPVPAQPGQNPPIFYQYSVPINSHNSTCQALRAYDGTLPDQYGYGPNGWKEWLRPDSFKVFVEVSDDGLTCTSGSWAFDDKDTAAGGQDAAAKFDAALLALDPAMFGDAEKRNYVWHSIVGLKEGNPASDAYQPADPLVTGVCSTAVAPGSGYQVLSQLTGGLRFPICEFESYDVVFQEIAKGVIEGAKVACEIPIPEAPDGQTIDLTTVVLEYAAGGVADPVQFKQVPTAADCKPSAFYIEDKTIKLCPDTCAVVQADDKAQLSVLFGCEVAPD